MTTLNATCVDGDPITVTLPPEEADAVVYTVALELGSIAEDLSNRPVSRLPGDLAKIEADAARVARLAAVGDQLLWRAHWAQIDTEPPILHISPDTLLDVAGLLQKRAAEQVKYGPDEHDGAFVYAEAARTLARCFAEVV